MERSRAYYCNHFIMKSDASWGIPNKYLQSFDESWFGTKFSI